MGNFVVTARESRAQTRQSAGRSVPVPTNRIAMIWDSAIGKKVVMAVTGIVLVGFVIVHMLGNLKIFAGPDEINAYSRFLRTVGQPELGYGDALWVVRIVLLTCVTLHITAAYPTNAHELGWRAGRIRNQREYRDDFRRAHDALGRRASRRFSLFFISRISRWARSGSRQDSSKTAVYQNVMAGFAVWPVAAVLHRGDGRAVPPSRPRNLEHAANARLEHRPQHEDA